MVGCPAKGNSCFGVKILRRYSVPAADGASTKVVSERLVHAAILCISSVSSLSASKTTATGFPEKGFRVKTSTCLKRKPDIRYRVGATTPLSLAKLIYLLSDLKKPS